MQWFIVGLSSAILPFGAFIREFVMKSVWIPPTDGRVEGRVVATCETGIPFDSLSCRFFGNVPPLLSGVFLSVTEKRDRIHDATA